MRWTPGATSVSSMPRGYPIAAGIRASLGRASWWVDRPATARPPTIAHGASVRGYLARMLFFSSGLGCFGSILLSVILTLALLFVLRVI